MLWYSNSRCLQTFNSAIAFAFMILQVNFDSFIQWKVLAKQVSACMLWGNCVNRWETSHFTPPLFISCAFLFFNLQVEVAIVTQSWNKLPVCFLWLIADSFDSFFSLPLQSLAHFKCVDYTLFITSCRWLQHTQYIISLPEQHTFSYRRGRNTVRLCFITELTSASY